TAKEYAIKRQIKNRVWFVNHADSSQKKELINWFRQVLIGKISFIGQVKGKDSFTFLSFAKQFNALFSESYFDISLLLSTEELVVQNTFILEDANSGLQGTGIFLPDIGLLTCNHLVDQDDFFEVIYIDNDSEITLTNVCKSMNAIYSNYDIDFSIFQIPNSYTVPNTLKIGDSTNLKMGDKVIIGGYPQHATGNTPHIQTCEITSIRNYHGAKLYTVSGQVVHGSSGGLVLNSNLELIGMIKAGVSGITSESASVNHGFIPIHLVLDYVIARD
ncbi:MAG: trypsin-like peptidase domain-containing protein, partial [Bacteroidales bacterium]|nr:trypsin-like peptidase domain-containing protein [Bacteroidales bacterium]